MRIQGTIFDFDGTLADTLPLCCSAFREVAQQHLGRDYSDAEIVAMFGPSEEGIFQQIAATDGTSVWKIFSSSMNAIILPT